MAIHDINAHRASADVLEFTRPEDTTPYGAGDLVADDTTAGSVTPISFSLRKTSGRGHFPRCGTRKGSASSTNASFRVHFFSAAPTVANGDNGALAVTSNLDSYLGSIPVDMTSGALAGSGGAVGLKGFGEANVHVEFDQKDADSENWIVYALIEALAAYTPASGEAFEIYPIFEDEDETAV